MERKHDAGKDGKGEVVKDSPVKPGNDRAQGKRILKTLKINT